MQLLPTPWLPCAMNKVSESLLLTACSKLFRIHLMHHVTVMWLWCGVIIYIHLVYYSTCNWHQILGWYIDSAAFLYQVGNSVCIHLSRWSVGSTIVCSLVKMAVCTHVAGQRTDKLVYCPAVSILFLPPHYCPSSHASSWVHPRTHPCRCGPLWECFSTHSSEFERWGGFFGTHVCWHIVCPHWWDPPSITFLSH